MADPFKINHKFKEKELNKSKGILDDFAVRKVINTREGTIEKVPVNNNDIVNKAYADSISGTYTDADAVAAVAAADDYLKNDQDDATTGNLAWNGGSSTQANTAYTHSQDNTQAHSDYLTATHTALPNAHHNKVHAITDTTQHTSVVAENQMLRANSNGLPADALTTKQQVIDAVLHTTDNTQAHSDYMLNTGDTATGNYAFDTSTLKIDATNHRVGIGDTAPNALLAVGNLDAGTAQGNLYVKSDANHKAILMEENSGAESWGLGINVAGDLVFYNSGTATHIFQDGGNVGIGTTTPTAKLHVVGLVDYANNAAAVTGGLTAGAFYAETGTNPKKVCVVY